MPIKPGDLMATAPGEVSAMIFDGKRMRVQWARGHGEGNSNKSLIDRCKNTVRGHPTWKMYCDDVSGHIIPDKNEPPRYVYLDDKACYAVFSCQLYTKKELNRYWPFDFDAQGNIQMKRPNRGRPAYVDDTCREYAIGPLRGKVKKYEFSGAPVFPEACAPVRPSRKEASQKMKNTDGLISLSGMVPHLPNTIDTEALLTLNGPPTGNTRPKRSAEALVSNTRFLYTHHIPTQYVSGPTHGSLKPLGMAQRAIQSSPYFDLTCATFRKRPRFLPGDLAGRLGGLGSKRPAEEELLSRPAKKKAFSQWFDVGSSVQDEGKKKVKVKVEEEEEVVDFKSARFE
jgi:hypothetical protein